MESGDYFEKPEEAAPKITVQDLRDKFVAAGLSCRIERDDTKVRIVFENRKCSLVLSVNEFDQPSMASMPDTTDYDAEFAQIIFEVFDSIGWKFQP
jgi:hypothetical protein